jgi:hypothetical protein
MQNNYGLTHQKLQHAVKHKHSHRQFMNNASLHQLKNMKDLLEAYNTKTGLMTFRKKLLEDQTKHNYSMEYDKIRGLLENSALPFRTQAELMNRRDELKKLGAKALSIS